MLKITAMWRKIGGCVEIEKVLQRKWGHCLLWDRVILRRGRRLRLYLWNRHIRRKPAILRLVHMILHGQLTWLWVHRLRVRRSWTAGTWMWVLILVVSTRLWEWRGHVLCAWLIRGSPIGWAWRIWYLMMIAAITSRAATRLLRLRVWASSRARSKISIVHFTMCRLI